jgi:acetylglutamate kinase
MTDHAPDPAMLAKAETLTDALPYMQRYAGKTFVVKYGGHAMGDAALARNFAEDIVLLKAVGINPVVVHGGGPQIGAMLQRVGVESKFVDGLRVTTKETAEIAEMVLSGAINKELVSWIERAGGHAIGISGKDGGFVKAAKLRRTERDPDSNIERIIDLGYVGEPKTVNRGVVDMISSAGMIPVIAPIGVGEDGHTYNINADTMAGAVAGGRRAAPPRIADRSRAAGDQRTGQGWHHLRWHDSETRDLRESGSGRRRCGGYTGWPDTARDAARNLHQQGCRYPGTG